MMLDMGKRASVITTLLLYENIDVQQSLKSSYFSP